MKTIAAANFLDHLSDHDPKCADDYLWIAEVEAEAVDACLARLRTKVEGVEGHPHHESPRARYWIDRSAVLTAIEMS